MDGAATVSTFGSDLIQPLDLVRLQRGPAGGTMGWQCTAFRRRPGRRPRGSGCFKPGFGLVRFVCQSAFVELRDHTGCSLMQPWELPALGQQFESASQRRHAQGGLSGQEAGASGLKVEKRGAWTCTGRSRLGDPLEELTGPAIFTFVEG